jgi:hypothetical protein
VTDHIHCEGSLFLGEATFTAAREPLGGLVACLRLAIAALRYRFQSQIPVDHFRSFLEAVKENDIQITSENVSGLSQLCAEFGFRSLSSKLLAHFVESQLIEVRIGKYR